MHMELQGMVQGADTVDMVDTVDLHREAEAVHLRPCNHSRMAIMHTS